MQSHLPCHDLIALLSGITTCRLQHQSLFHPPSMMNAYNFSLRYAAYLLDACPVLGHHALQNFKFRALNINLQHAASACRKHRCGVPFCMVPFSTHLRPLQSKPCRPPVQLQCGLCSRAVSASQNCMTLGKLQLCRAHCKSVWR